ncbi:hypothetical protein FRC10_006451 [Ceratobasidium sp. 414]|nr:hypothetical protein FRC10_006451 [Ceratobasidium sp. 414]
MLPKGKQELLAPEECEALKVMLAQATEEEQTAYAAYTAAADLSDSEASLDPDSLSDSEDSDSSDDSDNEDFQ